MPAGPRSFTEYIKARQGNDYSHHGRAGNPSTDFAPDEIVDRFCLLGPAEAHVEKLRSLRDLGVDQFVVYAMHDARGGRDRGLRHRCHPDGQPPAADLRAHRPPAGSYIPLPTTVITSPGVLLGKQSSKGRT